MSVPIFPKHAITNDPVIILLGIHPREIEAYISAKTVHECS